MRILLINPNPKNFYKATTCPLGLLSIATHLNQRGHTVLLVDNAVRRIQYKKVMREFLPDVVGVSVISYKSVFDAIAASEAAQKLGLPVVWGGPLVSVVPQLAVNNPCVDYVVIGEGELTFEELLKTLASKGDMRAVDGLAFSEEGEVFINKDRAFADLATLPVLDWSLVNPADYFQKLFTASNMLYIYSAKGCPGRCEFCFNKSINKCVYRKRPFEYCLEELDYLTKNTAIDGVHFADELWCRNREEMVENCDKLRQANFNIVWGCNARIGTYEKEDFEYMYSAGCRWMFFGVESGSESVQKQIKKGISLQKVEETINHCADAGIVPVASFIIGFPDETPSQVAETVELALKIPRAMYDFNYFFPLIGSELCEKLIAAGRYSLPVSLRELGRLVPTEKMQRNFSKIPKKDLRVIRAFFLWSSFSRKEPSAGMPHRSFSRKVLTDAFKRLSGHGFMSFVRSSVADGLIFVNIVLSLLCHPRIRRKYNLYR